MVKFLLIVTEKFRKGTDVRTLGTFATQTLAEQQRSQIKFVGKRGQPFIIPESELPSFRQKHLSGIFKPSFDPIKAAATEQAKIRRQKEQSRFERLRTTAKKSTRQGEISRQILASEFGFKTKPVSRVTTITPTTSEQFQRSLFAQQRFKETTQKQDLADLQARIKELGLVGVKQQEVIRRARETRKAQLRKAGAEVVFKPSEKLFALVPPTEEEKKEKVIPKEADIIQELKAQKGFVTFIAPEKEGFKERKKEISIFKPIVVKEEKKRELPLTTLGIPRKFKPEDLILVTPVAGLSPVPESKFITKTRQELLRLFPKSPVFVSTVIGGLVAIKEKPIVKIGPPLLIGAGLTLLPEPVTTIAGLALLGITAKQFIQATSRQRQVLTGELVTDLPFFFLGAKTGKAAKRFITEGFTKIIPSFRKVDVDFLGEKIIKDIPTKGGELLDLGLIPPGKGGLRFDIKSIVSETTIPFKDKPTLPKTTKTQADILEVIKGEPAIITGSFAQSTLLKKSRGFADIDIVTKDISAVAKSIKKKLGDKVIIETKSITDSPLGKFKIKRIIERKTGRVLADIDPLKFAEEGLLKGKFVDVDFPIRTIEGVRLAPLESRLAAKLSQLSRGKQFQKVIKDVELLTGVKDIKQRLGSPLIRGAFGFTREEQAAFIGRTGPVTTSARDLFGIIFRKEVELKEPGLFATPFELLTGRALTRVSRLALKEREATPLDLLRLNFRFKGGRPQIVVFPKQKIGEQFKAFGFPSSELEVLLKAGKIIKKEKQIAITLIEGKKVPIIEAKIGEASKRTRDLLLKKKIDIVKKEKVKIREITELDLKETEIRKLTPKQFAELLIKEKVISKVIERPFLRRVKGIEKGEIRFSSLVEDIIEAKGKKERVVERFIEIEKRLPRHKKEVSLAHELIHIRHPEWSEARVLAEEGTFFGKKPKTIVREFPILLKKKIDLKEQQELIRRLSKETGFDVSSILDVRPILRPSKFIPKVSVTRKVTRTREIITKAISRLPFIETTGVISGPPSRRPSAAVSAALLGPISVFPSIPPSRQPSGPVSGLVSGVVSGPPSGTVSGRPSRPISRLPSKPISVKPSGFISAIPDIKTEPERIGKKGFDTFLRRGERRGDKFVKISDNKPLNRAVRIGSSAADNFIEASFIVKPSGKRTRKFDVPRPNLKKFRGIKPGSKLPGRTIIERKGKRLDTLGEVNQISFFREQAKRSRIVRQIQRRKATPRRISIQPTPKGVMRFL